MHSLLKRQVEEFLPQGTATSPNMEKFLQAVGQSYKAYEEQLRTQQGLPAMGAQENAETVDVDLNRLVANLEKSLQLPNHVRIKIKGKLPVLHTAKARLTHLFANVLANAVDATAGNKTGLITIEARVQEDSWLFCIADNGKGIPEHAQTGIFEMFKKLENEADTTGAGLAQVKRIVNYYKGDIWLSSGEGLGTTFYFTIKQL